MIRFTSVLVGLVLASGLARADDEIGGKTRAEWLKLLKTAKVTKTRQVSLLALEALGPRSSGVTDGVIEALEKDADAEVRRDAAGLLGRMGTDAKGAVDALAEALKTDKEGIVRQECARSLKKFAAQVDTQIFILAGALLDSHAGTRAAAADTMNALGDKAKLALPQLLKVLADKKADRLPRIYAARIVGRFDTEARTTVPALNSVLADKKAPLKVREAAAEALGRLGTAADEAAEPLAGVVQAPNEQADLRRAAVVALGKVGAPTKIAWPAVKSALKAKDSALRHQAIRLAGTVSKDEKAAVTALADAAAKDDNTENRLAAIQELGQLGSTAADAVPVLTQLTSDSRGSVREAAAEALKKIKAAP